jgi:3-mercaptopyruvate sulfurtransferase SseA
MLSGYDDAYRVYSNNMSQAVGHHKVVHLDDQIKAWIKATKTYTDSGYNDKTSLWDAQWQQEPKDRKAIKSSATSTALGASTSPSLATPIRISSAILAM